MKKRYLLFFGFAILLASFLMPGKTYAICQIICPVLVGGTLTLLEKYGIDNSISGLWIGGMLMICSILTIDWLKKWASHWLLDLGVFLLFYVGTILPLFYKHIIGDPHKMLFGMDKTILGIIIGSIFFYLGDWSYERIKAKNGGHAWFPFQKAIMPIIPLAIFSVVFYFVTKK